MASCAKSLIGRVRLARAVRSRAGIFSRRAAAERARVRRGAYSFLSRLKMPFAASFKYSCGSDSCGS
jgi:hypothetical protein